MTHGLCLQSLIPQRAEANERSEMVNQLLFGEDYQVLNVDKKWLQVKNLSDGYIGFIDASCHFPLSYAMHNEWLDVNKLIVNQFQAVEVNGQRQYLNPGSILPFEALSFLNHNYQRQSKSVSAIAQSFINAPYLWGGKGFLGIDCSGFTQVIYRSEGTYLPRDAYQQATIGKPCQPQEGALAFFKNKDGKITHVGYMLNKKQIIHASGKVRIDDLSPEGIIRSDTQVLSHHYSHCQCVV